MSHPLLQLKRSPGQTSSVSLTNSMAKHMAVKMSARSDLIKIEENECPPQDSSSREKKILDSSIVQDEGQLQG